MCSCSRGMNYSSEKNTWTPKTSLRIAKSSDPFPELQNQADCYGNLAKENYFKMQRQVGATPPMNIAYNSVGVGFKPVEGYQAPCCRAQPYTSMDGTWLEQQPYSL